MTAEEYSPRNHIVVLGGGEDPYSQPDAYCFVAIVHAIPSYYAFLSRHRPFIVSAPLLCPSGRRGH